MRTDEMMFPLVEQWKKSGLSIKAFSASQGLNNFSFQYWCKKYKVKKGLHKKADPRFIPIWGKLKESTKSTATCSEYFFLTQARNIQFSVG